MRTAVRRDVFVIFAAYDTVTQCFGSLSRARRSAARAQASTQGRRQGSGQGESQGSGQDESRLEPNEILRAQLMGGSLSAIDQVAYLYDQILLEWMQLGEVFDKEEPILTLAWDMVVSRYF